VFSKDPQRGNPAMVAFADAVDEATLADARRAEQAVMAVLVGSASGADARFRFFAPLGELDFCGHGILAGALAFARRSGRAQFTVETRARRVRLSVSADGLTQFLTIGPVGLSDAPERARLHELMRLPASEIDDAEPLCVGSIGSKKLLLPVRSLCALRAAAPDLDAIRDWSARHQVNGLYVYTRQTEAPDAFAHARGFNPLFGVDEDVATGVAAGALGAVYAARGDTRGRYVIEQGHGLGRASEIFVDIDATGVSVGGFVKDVQNGTQCHT
jgi:PhzF family phenazine biosynthesis protein